MNLKPKYWKRLCLIGVLLMASIKMSSAESIRIHVENSLEGAPLTLGIPFPQGVLDSPDHLRVLNNSGQEIPSQTNLVTTWEPIDYSVKWVWVFFFSTGDNEYILEYGEDVRKAPILGDRIKIKNAQRAGQSSYAETGPLRFTISKRSGGFIDDVLLDLDRDGFDGNDTIAVNNGGRGSFLDILDDLGIDSSTATIHRTVRERGSGPLHTIMRLDGNYTYSREDNRDSPFIIRIHLYAGKSYIRVFHTLTYTGIPDKHIPVAGEHENIALTDNAEIKDDSKSEDPGWMEPNDQIAGTGLTLHYRLDEDAKYITGFKEGSWSKPGKSRIYKENLNSNAIASVYQTGPKPDRIPPVPNSTLEERIEGFSADISLDGVSKKMIDRAEGWADISDERWGIGIGIRNFLEEYPKEIAFDMQTSEAVTYLWSPKAGPMSFARNSAKRDQGMISNFAEGVTKTSEMVIYFHQGGKSDSDLKRTMDYFLNPPVPHASSETYSNSLVYGHFSPRTSDNEGFERALDYKFGWELFNQHWEPWYGMFDFGDQKNIFFREDWYRWQNNEPAIDFMYWLQFMRTGESKYYFAAEAMSRHTMDVDNVHWPVDPPFYGDTNESLDFWKWKSKESVANPYLGVGRRHANQHWLALLSAHVWLEGWLASYYLTGYHRGLDIARLTADSYTRRIWGDHDLTGRRLYLSVWNMVEAWDATKDPAYLKDLKDRIDVMLHLQNGPDQYDNLIIDRYGYSQNYATHGLYKYYQLTKDERIRQALIRHARAVRDNPPYNHEYESYFATIHSLTLGYEFTGDRSFLDEALRRAETMKTDELSQSFDELGNQKKIAEALEDVSNLPTKGDFSGRSRWIVNWSPTQGLRVFGWTHIYNIPWLLHWIREGQ
jgi:hypothetical protein